MLRRASAPLTSITTSFQQVSPSEDVVMTTSVVKDYDTNTGNKLINHYMIIKEIGRGVHGKVKLAQDLTTGELVAIKIVDKKNRRRQMGYSLLRGSQYNGDQHPSKENEMKIRREIAILKKCHHPNVVKLREVIDDPTSRKIYMALEYTESGEIEWRDEMERPVISIDEARRIFRDIVNGLDYLHYQGIIHRDIKPANLLLSHDGVAKISDFGVSYYNELLASNATVHPNDPVFLKIDRELAETAGTPAFFAPELCCAGDSMSSTSIHIKKPRITKAIDVWALGVTLYCFIFGQCPFIAATEFELFDTIPTQPLTFPPKEEIGFEISHDLKDLLERLLEKDSERRITLNEVKNHPWVIADLNNPQGWISYTSPHNYLPILQSPLELSSNESIMDRLRHSIRKLSFSFGTNNRKQSATTTTKRPLSYQPQFIHRLSQPNTQTSYSTSLLPHTPSAVTPTVSLSTGHTLMSVRNSKPPIEKNIHPLRPISSSYLTEDEEDYDDDVGDNESTHEYGIPRTSTLSSRPRVNRRVSSASSSSGIGLTFGRGMTPLSKE